MRDNHLTVQPHDAKLPTVLSRCRPPATEVACKCCRRHGERKVISPAVLFESM